MLRLEHITVRQLKWENYEGDQLAADAFGGRYVIYDLYNKFEVIWMFGETFRRILSNKMGLSSVEEAQSVADFDFKNHVLESLELN